MRVWGIGGLLLGSWLVSSLSAEEVRRVASPPRERRTSLYVSNRAPLAPSPLVKLPPGAIQPQGWLRHQLDLMRQGLTGRLPEISPWCKFAGNAWTDPQGKGHSGWEEMPYWLKGFGDLGYVTGDEQIRQETKRWLDAILASQTADGWFGPAALRHSLQGKPDLWPHMIVLNCLQSWYEFSGDPRVLPFMTRYFRWQNQQPADQLLNGYWPKMRGGDNLESIYWLYNRTGESWLLALAVKIHRATADWTGGVANRHGVNFAQGFREPATFWMQSHEERHRLASYRDYDEVMGTYGQFPGGGFAADENMRPGYTDPRQGFETCAIVEFLHSFEMLTRITGDPLWADRAEELAFNTFPAALTPDAKALHYLTAANQVQLDRRNKAPGIENSGTMFSYSPFAVYRCCQHNVSHGWPYYAEELWLATSDAGLCASLYAPSRVTAKVAHGQAVTLTETTDYPFGDTILFDIQTVKPVRFPLYLRLPAWARNYQLEINKQAVSDAGGTGSYLLLDRTWQAGDRVQLRLPRSLEIKTWPKNHHGVSVHYGPLAFSLLIGEKWVRYGGTEAWPEWEVYPTTPFNYGLVLRETPAASFQLERKPGPLPANPFTPQTVPLRLRGRGRRIPEWTQDATGLLQPLQESPAWSVQPEEEITLIPMGAARLRLSLFPVVHPDPQKAHRWVKPARPPQASHCWHADTTAYLDDGRRPRSSDDHTLPRFTWWDHKGTVEWVQYDFEEPRRCQAVQVYWFDDEPSGGGCRLPASWRLLYRVGDEWREVPHPSGYGLAKDRFNVVRFDPIVTTALRLEVQLRAGYSGGLLKWRVE